MSTEQPIRIVDGALDAMIVVDADQRIVDLNPASERMFGFMRSDVLGEDMTMLIVPPESQKAQRIAFERATGGGEPRLLGAGAARFVAMRCDGTRFPLELSLSQTSIDPLEITAWMHDRTKEERTERQATLSERVELAVGVGSWEWNTATDVAEWTDGLYKMFGYEAGEVVPTGDLALGHVHPDDRDRVAEIMRRMIDEGYAEPYEYRVIGKTGQLVYMYVTVALTEDGEGGTVLRGSALDVTAQRDAERRANVITAVVEWAALAADRPLEEAIGHLLNGILPPSEGIAASFWTPRGGILHCRGTAGNGAIDTSALSEACGQLELPPGAGLPGRAWQSEKVVYLKPGERNDHARARAMDDAGLSGGVAFPAMAASGVVGVLEVLVHEPVEPSPPGLVGLRACGVLIGEFLSHRRGELEPTTLTKREIEILQLASEGLTGPRIAERLVISPATVKSHFEHIYPKLGVTDRPAAVAESLRLGLIR